MIHTPASTIITPEIKKRSMPSVIPLGANEKGRSQSPRKSVPATVKEIRSGTRSTRARESGPDDDEREPQHVQAHLLRLKALPDQACPGERGRKREEDALDTAALPVRLRYVANGPYHVQAAHPPGGDQDDREREHHAEAERYDHVLGACGEGDLEARACERFADYAHHQPPYPHAGDAPEGAREQGVECPLEGEHPHQVPSAHPDGARYTELVFALRGEHDEDQEDQEHASPDRELPEEQEDAREGLPTLVGLIYGLLLDGLGLQVVLLEEHSEGVPGGAGACGTLDGRALVGDEDGVDLALLPYPLLQPLQWHDHRGRRGRIRPALVDASHG